MTIEEAVYAALVDDPEVATLVGNRIYANVMPQGVTEPAVAYRAGGSDEEQSCSGPLGAIRAQLTLSCFAETYAAAKALAAAVRGALNGSAGPWGNVEIGYAKCTESGDDYNADLNLHLVTCDLEVLYLEA